MNSCIITSENPEGTRGWFCQFFSNEDLPEFIAGSPDDHPPIRVECPDKGTYDRILMSVSGELNPVTKESADGKSLDSTIMVPGRVKVALRFHWN